MRYQLVALRAQWWEVAALATFILRGALAQATQCFEVELLKALLLRKPFLLFLQVQLLLAVAQNIFLEPTAALALPPFAPHKRYSRPLQVQRLARGGNSMWWPLCLTALVTLPLARGSRSLPRR